MVKLDEELSKLPPEERIRRIEEYKKQRQEELDLLKKKGEEAEIEIQKSIEDAIIEEEIEKKQDEEQEERRRKEAEEMRVLERTVEQERPPPPPPGQAEYKIPGEERAKEGPLSLYQVAGQETRGELYRLRGKDVWDAQDAANYHRIKEDAESARHITEYKTVNQQVYEGLHTTLSILRDMGQETHDYKP
jgi:hypothetical protein